MEGLRNHMQHRGFLIGKLKRGGKWVENEGSKYLLNHMIPYIVCSPILSNKKVKEAVRKELEDLQDEDIIDVRPLIREYIECIGMIHESLRESLKSDIDEWEKTYNGRLNDCRSTSPDRDIEFLFYAVEVNESGCWENRVPMNTRFIERRKQLEKKNSAYKNLSLCFVSNVIDG
jgi:hypothetical protein